MTTDQISTTTRPPDVGGTQIEVPGDAELAGMLEGDFRSEHADVDGVRMHYVTGGTGRPLVLLPGWPQTWWEFRKVMPALAASGRQVIAVDLPGMGGSQKTGVGLDKRAMAHTVRGLVAALGHDQVDIAGHDMGSQVAFSFAANHPEATRRIAMLDILHPHPSNYEIRMLPVPGVPMFPWWFAFNQVEGLPERLLEGRFRLLVDWLFDTFLVDPDTVTDFDRAVFAAAYDTPEGIAAGNGWYQTFGQDIVDLADYAPLKMPVLGIASNLGEGMFAQLMKDTLPQQAVDAEVVFLPEAGHYFVDEEPETVITQLDAFFE